MFQYKQHYNIIRICLNKSMLQESTENNYKNKIGVIRCSCKKKKMLQCI